MNPIAYSSLAQYWSAPFIQANLVIALNLLGSFLLGLVVGYERSYRGRAAGMRTYGLVCMASAALTVIAGYPHFWYGGQAISSATDPTRVVQGIVTGIGFLGAGVIMKEGFNISGLTTSASIWASSVIGVMVGAGFYVAGILMAFTAVACTAIVSRLEGALPQRAQIAVVLHFKPGFVPQEETLRRAARERGYEVLSSTLSIQYVDNAAEWHFIAEAFDKRSSASVSALSAELTVFAGVDHFSIAHSRN